MIADQSKLAACCAPAPPAAWSAAGSPRSTCPSFGGLVRIPLDERYQVFGLIYDIHIDDDGLVRQLVTAENVSGRCDPR